MNYKSHPTAIIDEGAEIGDNSIIGACSQVRAHVDKNEIWYGSPAKFYKNNE